MISPSYLKDNQNQRQNSSSVYDNLRSPLEQCLLDILQNPSTATSQNQGCMPVSSSSPGDVSSSSGCSSGSPGSGFSPPRLASVSSSASSNNAVMRTTSSSSSSSSILSGSLTDLQSGAGPHGFQDLQASQQSHLSAVQSHLNFQSQLFPEMTSPPSNPFRGPSSSSSFSKIPFQLRDGFFPIGDNIGDHQQQQQQIPPSSTANGRSFAVSSASTMKDSEFFSRSLLSTSSSTESSPTKDDQRSSGEECLDDLEARRARLPSPLGSSGGGGLGSSLDGLSGFGSLALVGGPSEAEVVNGDVERFSRKVFVGGLPPDIDEEEITASFRRFGPLVVDWPHKAESKSYFPPKGYAFLLFQNEASVGFLIDACLIDGDKLYFYVSSPTIKHKPVQIRPWNLGDSDFVMDGSSPLDPRKTIFVGGVPRPLRALELAMIMDRLYGGVCYAGIDTDPELKYPKGAGRVAFSNQQSYIAAISARFVQLQHGDIDKRVEVKPYVLDDQMCDECAGTRCAGKFAPFFCANVTCLQYYCEYCWVTIHSRAGRQFHKPLVKERADRPRTVPFRWS